MKISILKTLAKLSLALLWHYKGLSERIVYIGKVSAL